MATKQRKARLDSDANHRTRYERSTRMAVARQVRQWLSMQVIPTPSVYRRAREVIAANVPNSTSSWRLRNGKR